MATAVGRYSREELKALDSYAANKGMELIPCIQTLAHLNAIKRWPAYRDRTGILLKHLARVAEIGRRYGLKLCMWSDMFFRLAGGDYYNPGAELRGTVIEQIPENVELSYWDYYHKDIGHYRSMLEAHRKLWEEIWFAGGRWTWTGFAPHNAISIRNTKAALTACEEKGTDNVLLTLWGDDGGECSRFSVLPALFHAAQTAEANRDEKEIRRRFAEKYEVSWED